MIPIAEETESTEHLSRLTRLVEHGIASLVPPGEPAALYEPVRYVLESKGKRLRPLLVLLGAEVFGRAAAGALPAALAVEVFHAFSLVHDDIMDHAAERRGRPTVHVRWDESTAILCGDFLMALAYDQLARVETPRLPEMLRTFQGMVVRLCEGQALDKAFETQPDVSVDEYLSMIERKTGALLETSLVLGGLAGGAEGGALEDLRQVGAHVGRAFQIQDDLLDLTARDAGWGKRIGGDLIEGKKTFLLLRAIERAGGAEREWFMEIVRRRGLPADSVPEARARMERLGVLAEAEGVILTHYQAAHAALDRLPRSPAVRTMERMMQRMLVRVI